MRRDGPLGRSKQAITSRPWRTQVPPSSWRVRATCLRGTAWPPAWRRGPASRCDATRTVNDGQANGAWMSQPSAVRAIRVSSRAAQ